MLNTLQKKGFTKVATLSKKEAYEYTEKEGSISWWDKPPAGMASGAELDWEASTQEELSISGDGVEQEAQEEGATSNPEQELQECAQGWTATDQETVEQQGGYRE